MEKKKHILIICGEPSGDMQGAYLIRSIKEIMPDVNISGVGGELMLKAGADVFCDIKDLAVIGFFDVLKKLPKFISLKKNVLRKIRETNPDLIILIDFSGFNLRIAKEINKAVPVFYYISPQVWASRPGRIKTIKEYIDRMIVVFKFEEEFYRRFDIKADFVGHPLLDIVKSDMSKGEFCQTFGLDETKRILCLLPGSRKQEINKILPVMLKSSLLINNQLKDIQVIIAKSQKIPLHTYNQIIDRFKIKLKIIENRTYDCLNAADFCLVASGTATLETAILQKPFIVIYKMSTLNYLLYRPQIKIPYISLVNILAGKKLIPEFIQFSATPEKISKETIRIANNPKAMELIIQELKTLKSSLGENGATRRAAKIICDFLLNK